MLTLIGIRTQQIGYISHACLVWLAFTPSVGAIRLDVIATSVK